MKNKSKHANKSNFVKNFDVIFNKLEEVKNEQIFSTDLTESDYLEINKSVQILQEIQQNIDTSSYTFFTRT